MTYRLKDFTIYLIFTLLSLPHMIKLKSNNLISKNNIQNLQVSPEELQIAFKAKIPGLENLHPHTQELINIYKNWNNKEYRKQNIDKLFSEFKSKQNMLYTSVSESQYRKQIFEKSVLDAGKHNLHFARGHHSYHLGITKFADITDEEFINRYTMKPIPSVKDSHNTKQSKIKKTKVQYPESVDFRNKNVIGPIEDQGTCGSCYSFSTVGATEAAYVMKNSSNTFHQLSKQEMVDCGSSTGLALSACQGGVLESAYKYLSKFGISESKDYPYTQKPSKCLAYKKPRFLTLSGYKMLDDYTKDGFLSMLAKQPMSIAVQMTRYLKLYNGGVVDIKGPCGFFYNHGILAVGYSNVQTSGTVPYLILKNTYGENWGENGYMLYRMGVGNTGMCAFINVNDSHPII